MKRLLFAAIIALIFVSCNKEKFPSPEIIRDAVTDLDGNTYDAVKIGDQIWMSENLRSKTIQNAYGDTIQLQQALSNSSYDMGCFDYNYAYPYGEKENEDVYGLLYSEVLIDDYCQICPDGWHLPDSLDWETLKSTVSEISGHKSKKNGIVTTIPKIAAYFCADEGWKRSHVACAAGNLNTPHRNFTGFNALPAGSENEAFPDVNGNEEFGRYAWFWCQSQSKYLLAYEFSSLSGPSSIWDDRDENGYGDYQPYALDYCSVRCVKD